MKNNQYRCRKCGGKCKPSKGFGDAYITEQYQTMVLQGEGNLIDCLKCEDCGHSFVPKNAESKNRQRIKDLEQQCLYLGNELRLKELTHKRQIAELKAENERLRQEIKILSEQD